MDLDPSLRLRLVDTILTTSIYIASRILSQHPMHGVMVILDDVIASTTTCMINTSLSIDCHGAIDPGPRASSRLMDSWAGWNVREWVYANSFCSTGTRTACKVGRRVLTFFFVRGIFLLL